MIDENEEIVIVLGTSGERITLQPDTSKRIWQSIREKNIQDPEAYVLNLLEKALTDPPA